MDHAKDPMEVLDACMALGIERILTSGGATFALDGANRLKELVARAGDRLVIAAAGGINGTNVVELIERTGVQEVHFAAQLHKGATAHAVAMSSTNQGVSFEVEPDRAKIEGVMNALTRAGLR